MPFVAILVGVILIMVAINNTYRDMAKELETDIPGYFVWGIAIAALVGLGFVPGLKTPSRWLLGLIVLTVALTQYKTIIAGFQQFAGSGGQTGAVTNPPPKAQSSGGGSGGGIGGDIKTGLDIGTTLGVF
jgi:predicted membrane protein